MTGTNQLFKDRENTLLLHYQDSQGLPNRFVYNDLPNQDVVGVLKGNFYENGKLIQLYSQKESHVGIIAATRIGKTTSYVMPLLLSYCKQKRKRSVIISDPKGELYCALATTYREAGYDVKLLNMRDHHHSECWNPLTLIYRKYRKAVAIRKEVQVVKTPKGVRHIFRGVTYYDPREFSEALENAETFALEDVKNDIDKISALLMPTLSKDDGQYWEDSAREMLKAFLWAMLEDSDALENPITEDTYSFSTILRLQQNMSYSGHDLDDNGYFTRRKSSSNALAIAQSSILVNSGNTAACILSTFNAKISTFRESALRFVTSCNTFEMRDLSTKPTAFFIIYRDELNVHYQLISWFVKNAYCDLVEYADSRVEKQLENPFYFVLDEFGNFPEIDAFEAKISAGGGRNIFFILVIQSYAQLDCIYGQKRAEIIRDNLNVHVFLGSNNPDTIEEFSRECGEKTVLSPLSALNGQGKEIEHYQMETVPTVPKSRLRHFDLGECIITEINCGYVFFSKMEPYYNIKEMNDLPRCSEKEYRCPVNPLDKRYIYDGSKRKTKHDDFDFLSDEHWDNDDLDDDDLDGYYIDEDMENYYTYSEMCNDPKEWEGTTKWSYDSDIRRRVGGEDYKRLYVLPLYYCVMSGEVSVPLLQYKCSLTEKEAKRAVAWMEKFHYITKGPLRKVRMTIDEFNQKFKDVSFGNLGDNLCETDNSESVENEYVESEALSLLEQVMYTRAETLKERLVDDFDLLIQCESKEDKFIVNLDEKTEFEIKLMTKDDLFYISDTGRTLSELSINPDSVNSVLSAYSGVKLKGNEIYTNVPRTDNLFASLATIYFAIEHIRHMCS